MNTASSRRAGRRVLRRLAAGAGSLALVTIGVALVGAAPAYAATPPTAITPSSIDFGPVPVGTASLAATVTLTELNNANTLTISSATISGSGEFHITTGPTCGGSPVVCTIGVDFFPTTAGFASATLAINGTFQNSAGGPAGVADIPLSGVGAVPTIFVAPNPVNFGTVADGTTQQETVHVHNVGLSPLSITSVGITGSTDFAKQTDNCSGQTIASLAECTVIVAFSPTSGETGNRTATLTVASNTSGGSASTVLQGTASLNPPTFTVIPTSIDFGNQAVGSTSAPVSVTISDLSGSLNVLGESVTADPTDFAVPSTCVTTLSSGGSCTFSVDFKPKSEGGHIGAVTVATSFGGVTVSLAGVGIAPQVELTPPGTVDFGTEPQGTASAPETVTFTNVGTANVTGISDAVVGPNASDFSIVADNCNGVAKLLPGHSCTVDLIFTPSTPGPTPESASLQFIDNAGSQSEPLTGTGANALAGTLSFSPNPVSFGTVTIGGTGTETATATNGGNAALTLGTVTVGGVNSADFAKSGDTCSGATLAPGASCTVQATFHPTTTNPESAFLSFPYTTNSTANTQDLTLSGNGGPANAAVLSFSPSPANFGSVAVGTSKTLTVTATNVSPVSVTLAPSIAGGNADFTLTAGSDACAGATLAPGNSCTIGVTFAPTTASSEGDTLDVGVGAAGPVQEDSLQGVGSESNSQVLLFSPYPVSFGSVPVRDTVTILVRAINVSPSKATLLTSIGGGNPDFVLTPAEDGCDLVTLPPGGSCTVGVSFTPTHTAPEQDTLNIFVGAAGPVQEDSLSGTGVVGSTLRTFPGSLSFPSTIIGTQSAAQLVTIINLGSAPVALPASPVSFSAADPGDFTVASDPCAGALLQPGQSCNIGIAFVPQALGQRSADALIEENVAGVNPVTVALQGTGVPPPPPPPGVGYRLGATDGGVFTFGNAGFFGSAAPIRLNAPIVGIASDPLTGGYWLVAADGGVFSFHAPFFGSAGGIRLNAPIVGMAVTPDGGGYWLVASDGGVFTYGDAAFYGSMGAVRLTAPVVGIAADAATGGYWLAGADGGVFSFHAPFDGSMGAVRLNKPVVGIASTPDGGGYWLAGSDGGIFTFGDAAFLGSTGNLRLNEPVVGIASTPDGGGYWLGAADGGVFTFGDAPFLGSMGNVRLNAPVVGIAST